MDLETDSQNLIGIFTTDADLVVQVWDAGLEKMSGISTETARGRSVVDMIPNLETRGLLRRFRRVLEEGTVEILAPAFHRFLIPCAPVFESKHFTEMRQRVTIAPLRENEEICGLIVKIEDVTERMESELEVAAELKNSDDAARLQAAKSLSIEPEELGEETAAPIIDALGDKNWRVRRELIESLSRRAAPDAIAALLRAMRDQHLDFGVLNSALQILRATSVKTTETLIEFLRGDDADLRMQAALTLGEQKDSQAIPALLEALGDENSNVRYHAVEALGKLQAREAVEPLLALAETRDFFLSFAALDALRQIADESISARIVPLLKDELLREAAIETLGAIGNEEIVSTLIGFLNKDKFSAVSVARALAMLSGRYETDLKKSADVVERARAAIDAGGKSHLLEALDSPNEADLFPLIRLAGWIDDEKIREKLAALIENENLREEAARVLTGEGTAAVDLLIGKLMADDPEVRRTAARSLAELKNKRATLPLIEILETDPELSTDAARALGLIGDLRALEPLAEMLQNGDAAERQAAVGALKSLAHPETVSRLCDLLTEDDPRVRESAVRVIGYFGATGCENTIFERCEDADEGVRRAAVEQLPQVEDERAVSILIRALKNDLPRVREAAAKSLASVKSEESVAALREALGDDDTWTRYFAVRALGSLSDKSSLQALTELAENDAAEQVRLAAREVLSGLRA